MARIERGDPSVAMASYVMCLWVINQTVGLADLASPENDQAALEREVNKVRQKLRPYGPVAAQTGARELAAAPGRAPGTTGKRHPAAEGLAALMASPTQPR
ncbi:hypothetical protein D9M69_671640 [compost metagenome]